MGYIEQIQSLLFDGSILHSNSASFSIFIHLLGKLLKRLVQIDMKNQVQKVMGEYCLLTAFTKDQKHHLKKYMGQTLLKSFQPIYYSYFSGRIFSKFGESKLVALNEIGIHNVISLFLTLAMTTDLQDLVS